MSLVFSVVVVVVVVTVVAALCVVFVSVSVAVVSSCVLIGGCCFLFVFVDEWAWW